MIPIVKIGRGIIKGIIDSFPVVSTIKNAVTTTEHKDADGITVEKTSVDYVRILTNIIVVLLIAGFVFGKISVEDLKSLLPFFIK